MTDYSAPRQGRCDGRVTPPSEALSRKGARRVSVKRIAVTVGSSEDEQHVIADISLEFAQSEIVAVLGPNGCGKSTLLRTIAGIIEPTSGVVERDPRDARIGIVFQQNEQNLLPWLTVRSNVDLPGRIRGRRRSDESLHVRAALGDLGILHLADRYPSQLSGGQQQLVTIARWLAHPQDILLIDEGWAMLDMVQRQVFYGVLRRLSREHGTAILVVSHNPSELARLAARVYLLRELPAVVATELVFAPGESDDRRSEQLWQAARKVLGETGEVS